MAETGNRRAIKQILEDLMGGKIGQYANFPCLEDMELGQEERANLTYDEVFAMNLLNKSLNGDMKATTEILDRRYGKAQQHIITEGKVITYHSFLDSLAIEEQDVPQITIDVSESDNRGSDPADLMSDLGL